MNANRDPDADEFVAYLKRASAEVATWPTWKRDLLEWHYSDRMAAKAAEEASKMDAHPWPAPGDWAYISRHAATNGILRARVVRVMATGGIEAETGYTENFFRRGEYHETEAEALHAAVKVVVAAIAEHQRSIEFLQGLASDYARQADGGGEGAEESPECLSRLHSS